MNEDDQRITQIHSLVERLLTAIEPRGKQACGVGWHEPDNKDGSVWYDKYPISAIDFYNKKKRWTFTEQADTIICHTRFATKGDPDVQCKVHGSKVFVNNHPVCSGSVVAVHNGMISNDDELFWNLKLPRHGTVDSEIIPALINTCPDPSDPQYLKEVADRLGELEGSMATAWLDARTGDEPILYLAKGIGSPLCIGVTPKGSVMFASVEWPLKARSTNLGAPDGSTFHLQEGEIFALKRGKILDVETFKPRRYTTYTTGLRSTGAQHYGKHVAQMSDAEYAEYLDMNRRYSSTIRDTRPITVTSPVVKPPPNPVADELDKEDREARDQAADEERAFQDMFEGQLAAMDATELLYTMSDAQRLALFAEFLDEMVGERKLEDGWRDCDIYAEAFANRETEIDDWTIKFRETILEKRPNDPQLIYRLSAMLRKTKALVRVGTIVQTKINGVAHTGQVVAVPNTFPRGQFWIRCTFSWQHRDGESVESVLVHRGINGFEQMIEPHDDDITWRLGDIKGIPEITPIIEALIASPVETVPEADIVSEVQV